MSSGERSRTSSRQRHDSRTTSYTRSRRNSYSDNSYSDYSDSFYSEDELDKKGGKNQGKGRGKKTNNRAPARGRGKPGLGRTSKARASPVSTDYVRKRMLSARRMKINELRSENENLLRQIDELKQENKTLLRQQRIADKHLERYEAQENDIPQLMKRHSEEVRVLREQLRRQKEKYQKTEKKLSDTEDELSRTKRLLRKMKGLVEDKQLKERDELSQKLSKLEAEVDDKSRKIQQLEHHIENLTKNHRHEIGIERARHRETAQKLQEVMEERQRLQTALKEKEKELEIKNIYSNRIMRPPHKLNSSVSSSPIPELSRPPRPRQRKNSTPSNMTPRERAKLFEEQRREEMRQAREDSLYNYQHAKKMNNSSPQHKAGTRSLVSNERLTNVNEQSENSKTSVKKKYSRNSQLFNESEKSKHISEENSELKFTFQTFERKHPSKSVVASSSEIGRSHQHGQHSSNNNTAESYESGTELRHSSTWGHLEQERKEQNSQEFDDRQIRRVREDEEKIRRENERRQKRDMRQRGDEEEVAYWKAESEQNDWTAEREEQGKREREERAKEEKDRRDRELRERQEREERERQEREEVERREREEKEQQQREERERRAREERERRERDEAERRAREEQQRLANEEAERERRRQKDLLLAKMKAIDESKTQEEIDPFFIPESRKSDKKDYTFTQPVENMYQGKPAYENVTVPALEKTKKKGLFDDEDDGFGYRPSFSNSKSPTKQKRAPNFGDSDNDSNSSKGRKPQAKKADLIENLFGGSSDKKNSVMKAPKKEASSTLFGGGSSIIDDEAPPASNSHLLPRRSRQQSGTLLRPAISAVDDIDDDIEEMVL